MGDLPFIILGWLTAGAATSAWWAQHRRRRHNP